MVYGVDKNDDTRSSALGKKVIGIDDFKMVVTNRLKAEAGFGGSAGALQAMGMD